MVNHTEVRKAECRRQIENLEDEVSGDVIEVYGADSG